MDSDQEQEEYKIHRKFAVDLFNYVWSLLDKGERSQVEEDTMLHAAHASRFHWEKVGTSLNLARGEWQVSRVYSILKRPEPALHHARRCLEICQENQYGDFDLAFAYEALARASAVAGDEKSSQGYLRQALQAAEQIAEEDDKQYFLSDIATVPDYEQVLQGSSPPNKA